MNPVLLRELRGRMRGRRAFLALGLFVLIHCLVFLAIFSFELIPAFDSLGHGSNRLARVGRSLFKGFMALLAVLVALFTPAFTATSLSQERDKKTLDFLRLTLLSPFQIVTGKLIGAFLYVNLLIVTSLPILGVVFFVGGVDLNEIVLSYMSLGLEALVIGAFCIGLSAQKQTGSLNSAAAYFISIMGLWAIVPIVVEGTQHTAPWYGWDVPILLPAVPIIVLTAIFALHEAANGLKITAYDRSMSARLTALLWYVVAIFTILGWVPWHKSVSMKNLCEAVGLWYMVDGFAVMSAFIFFNFHKPSHIELEQPGLFWHFVPSREILRNRLANAPWFLLLLSVLGAFILGLHFCVYLPAPDIEQILKLLAYLTLAKGVSILAFGYVFMSIALFARLITPEPINAFIRCVIVTVVFFAIVVLPAFVMLHYHQLWQSGTFTYIALCFLAAVSPFSPLRLCHENMVPRHARLTLADISLHTYLPPWIVHIIIYGIVFAVFVIVARRLKTRVAKEVLGKAIIALFVLNLLMPSALAANLTIHLREGLGNVIRTNSWYPVELVVKADSAGYEGTLTIETSDGIFTRQLNIPPRGMKRHVLYVQGHRRAVKAEGQDEDEVVLFARNSPNISTDSFFIVLIAPNEEHGCLEFLKLVSPSRASSSAQTVVVPLTRKQLPDSFLGYGGVDVIVLGNEDYEQFTTEQNRAIEQYLMRGGTLIVPGGVKPERFRRCPFKYLFPGKLEKTKQMKSLASLVKHFKKAGEDLPTEVERPFLVTLCEPAKDARVVYAEDGFPIVVERHEGSGRVVFLAFDVQMSPLALQSLGWLRLRLWRLLLPWRGYRYNDENLTIPEAWTRQEPVPYTQVRCELVKQALRIDTVEPPSATAVFLFVLSYVFIVGPIQYVVLQRRRRLEWAWVVTPLIALSYFFIAFLVGSYRLGGQRLCRQLTVLSGRADGANLKEDTFVRLFTDRTDSYLASPTNCPGLVVPGVSSYRKKENFQIDGRGVNAGPVRLHVWSERDYISLGLRKNELAISGDFTLDGNVLKGIIENSGTTTLRRICFVTTRSYAFLDKKNDVLAPGDKKAVELQLQSITSFGRTPPRLKNLQEFEDSKLLAELVDDLDPTELYLHAFLNDNERPVKIDPNPDKWDVRTVAVLQMNIHRQLGTAFIHSPKRVNVWCRYENRSGRKSSRKEKKQSEQWQRHETVETSIDAATRIHLRADFPDLSPNIEVDEVEVIFYKRRGSCNIDIHGPDGRTMTENFSSWRDEYRSRVIVVPQKFLTEDNKVELSIESDGQNSVHLGNIRFLLRGRKRAP